MILNESDVIAAIKAILVAIDDEDDEPVLAAVHDHIPPQYTAYPSAYIVPLNWQEDYVDLRDTGVNATFRIGVVYTLNEDTEEAQIELRNTVTLIRDELKKQENIQLGGTVDWSQLTQGTYTYDTKEQMVAVCEIDLSVRKRYSRYE